MSSKINKFLLAGYKFMPALRQPGSSFTCSTCRIFTKKQNKNTKIQKTGDARYIYRNELYNTCFQHNITFGDFKDLPRMASDKVLRDEEFENAVNS